MSAARALLERAIDALENPILVKELRGAFRRRRYLYLLTTLLGVAAVIVLGTVSFLSSSESDPGDAGRASFFAFFAIELALVSMVFPAFSCTSIVEERLSKSFDLLVTTRLQARQIVMGKLLASTVYGFTFIAATAPLVAIAFLYGGVTPGQILFAYLTLFLVGIVASAYAIMVSSMAVSAARAVVRTFLLLPFVLVFALAPFAFLVGGLLVGPLTKDRDLTRLGDYLQSLGAVNTILVWVGSLGWIAASVSLFFLVASNKVKPPLADRTSSLRGWFLIVWVSSLAVFLCVLGANPPAGAYECIENLARFFGLSLLVMGTAAVAFGMDDGDAPRLRSTLTGWRRLLGPGAQRGAVFVLSLAMFSYVSVGVVVLGLMGGSDFGGTRGWESPSSIIGWASAWSMGFLLALTQAGVLLSRHARHATLARVWLVFVVAVLTIYPMFWFHLDDDRAKGDFYKGYVASPWTVAWSTFIRPNLEKRQLVLFSRAGWEVVEAEQEIGRQVRGTPVMERKQALLARQKALHEEVRREGVRVHKVSIGLYWLLGLGLLALNLTAERRSEPPPPDSDSEPPAADSDSEPPAADSDSEPPPA